MTTVAEGVETEEQMARIAAHGCTDVQGYLISRPMPPELINGFLAKRG
jgi:EAL domain-containing protein (putative c-di-GMP-specific phosphodiesterase class I)